MGRARQPIIAITMGDPAGIGPEIVVKALADPVTADMGRLVVIGDAEVLARTVQLLETRVRVRKVHWRCEGEYEPGVLDVIDLSNVNPGMLHVGEVQATAGRAAFEAAVKDLNIFKKRWPKAVQSLITGRYEMKSYRDLLLGPKRGIKNIFVFQKEPVLRKAR